MRRAGADPNMAVLEDMSGATGCSPAKTLPAPYASLSKMLFMKVRLAQSCGAPLRGQAGRLLASHPVL